MWLRLSMLFLAFTILSSAAMAAPVTIGFDDIDASGGDIPITNAYSSFAWSNFLAYTTTPGFDGFNNGVVSPANAAYSGGEIGGSGAPITGSISSTPLFDFLGASLGAGYYNGLTLTISGRRGGSTLFSSTVTLDTNGARTFAFGFTAIDTLLFTAAATAGTTDPFGCGSFNCTQFTLDDLMFQPSGTVPPVPEPGLPALVVTGVALATLLRSRRSFASPRASRFPGSVLVAAFCAVLATAHLSVAQTLPSAPGVPLLRIVPGLEEPFVATGPTTAHENKALASAIDAFRSTSSSAADFADAARPFETFLVRYPASQWRTAILTDLGIGYYHAGYFTKATAAWAQAWAAGRHADAPQAKALADRAFGELVRMHARVGHADDLEALFADAGSRPISGSATELVTGAHEGLWMFRNDWGIAYLCGPLALKNLLLALQVDPSTIAKLDKVRSGPRGFTFVQVSQLAQEVGLQHRVVYRAPAERVPVPSVVNWKMHHYAAIIGEKDGRYHVKDLTFGGGDLWITKAAIDAEASGYFLVPTGPQSSLPWRTATTMEAERTYGMGFTGTNQPGSTTPCDPATSPASGSTPRMCIASATSMVVSLSLSDTPVGYRPQIGPPAEIHLTYNQREASQPAVFGFFNISPKWTLNVLSWVQDNPSSAGTSVLRYVAGGGAIDYSVGYGYSASTGAFTPERQGQSILVRVPATGPVTSYELRMSDGSKQVFARADGATAYPRRLFLTQIVDPQGNALTLNYDAQLRLTVLTDATRRSTTFSYGAANPLLVTRITDPFGRFASLAYDAGGRLSSITDVVGIASSFSYDAAGLVNAMTTPYGTSRFSYGQDTAQNTRFLEMTDPLGHTERVEFRHSAPGMPYSEAVAPAGWNNDYIYYRNTFHWDKNVYPITHTDYTKARITHWLHNPAGQTSPVVESVKMPLERRVWFRYPNQSPTYFEGSAGTPISIARVLDDNSTQARSFTYNSLGKLLSAVDAAGRRTVFAYSANGIDLTTVQQQTSAGGALSTIAAFTYNTQHRPTTYTDAAGRMTSYDYNASGQVVAMTDALSRTSTFEYDATGLLLRIVNADGAAEESFTYTSTDKVATRTDVLGHTVAYSYDALDRPLIVQYPDGSTTEYSYEVLDLAAIKDRLNRVTRFTYDANRRLILVTDPTGRSTSFAYYNNGVLRSITDPNRATVSWDIDIQSRPTAKHYADGRVETYTYEAATSRLKSTLDARNQTRNLTYFNDDMLKSVSYSGAITPTATVNFTYDPFFPRRTGMTDGMGTTTWSYYPVGSLGALELAAEDGPYAANDTVSYGYDAVGRLARRDVDSAAETFGYDNIDRLVTHMSALGLFNFAYLGESGQLSSRSSATGTVWTQWLYDSNTNDRRLLAIGNSGQARSFGFETNAESLITGIAESIGPNLQKSWSYEYDVSSRLIEASASSGSASQYVYDDADNLSSIAINGAVRTATHNDSNQIVSFGGTTFSYDGNGNLVDDGQRTYSWDAEDRLVAIGYKDSPGKSTTMRYDGIGRRLAIVEAGPAGTAETRYLWCGESICQARNNADVVVRRYFDYGVTYPLGGTALYYGQDQLGSVRDVTAVQNGAKLGTFDYELYGEPGATSGRTTPEFRYAGLLYHGPSGLYLANYRAYDPRIGRWLSRDPMAEGGGLNLYSYVGQNPMGYTDPSGECPWCIGAGIGFVTGGVLGGGWSIASDLWNSRPIDWGAAGRGALSGAIGGAVAGGTFGLVAPAAGGLAMQVVNAGGNRLIANAAGAGVGALSGAAGDLASQGARLGLGWQDCFSWSELGWATAAGGAFGGIGRELPIGNGRVAPFGNRVGNPNGTLPHYHRGVPNPSNPAQNLPGQGLGRHRPWDSRPTDRSFWDRF